MNKVLLSLVISLISLSVNTSAFASEKTGIEELKNTPATLYDVGKGKLEVITKFIGDKLRNERIGKTKFKLAAMSITEEDNKLQINTVAIGKRKHITETRCNNVLSYIKKVLHAEALPRAFGKDLSEDLYGKLKNEMIFRVAIIDKKDKSNALTCN